MNCPKRTKKGYASSFHANGACEFRKAVKNNPEYQRKWEAEKRQRIETLLAERFDEFQQAGYWKREAILKKIHLQVNREMSMAHCLF